MHRCKIFSQFRAGTPGKFVIWSPCAAAAATAASAINERNAIFFDLQFWVAAWVHGISISRWAKSTTVLLACTPNRERSRYFTNLVTE